MTEFSSLDDISLKPQLQGDFPCNKFVVTFLWRHCGRAVVINKDSRVTDLWKLLFFFFFFYVTGFFG